MSIKATVEMGQSSRECSVVVGGVDITSAVCNMTVRGQANCLTRLELDFTPGALESLEGEVREVVRVLPVAAPGAALRPVSGE